ncbi:MAG: D-alanine--D-alanine ligase [Deferrisomatales bacterium]
MERVAVLMGGPSAEREVSLKTGAAVSAALRRLGREVVEIDAGPDLAQQVAASGATVAFIALHGRLGEDGTVQGLLEVARLPYTGSGVLASALAMDKALSKVIFRALGVPTPDFRVLEPGAPLDALDLPLPMVVKPVGEGSTIGVSVVRRPEELSEAVERARTYGGRVLCEAFVAGREITVGVLDGEPLPLLEIVVETGLYDFEAKYTPGRTRYLCPAEVAEPVGRACAEAACGAYRALGCSGAARVDLIVDGDGRPWVLEVNTVPGLTPTSLLPKAAAAAGISFEQLVARMLAGAGLKA